MGVWLESWFKESCPLAWLATLWGSLSPRTSMGTLKSLPSPCRVAVRRTPVCRGEALACRQRLKQTDRAALAWAH